MTNRHSVFRASHPDLFFLDPGDLTALEGYLRKQGLIAADNTVLTADRAGEGNMNCTLRVRLQTGTLIVKQARPWVEKYPQFPAPWNRSCTEAAFYQWGASCPAVARRMPRLLRSDPTSRVLILEDLGSAHDYTDVYQGVHFSSGDLGILAEFLVALSDHSQEMPDRSKLLNREMRELNNAHIFSIPLTSDNGLDLDAITPGLAEAAHSLQADRIYCDTVKRLGNECYLADGLCLLHGDFFPGSLLRTNEGPKVIDPEFGFFGLPEFDPAVLLAHLILAGSPSERIEQWYGSQASRAEIQVDRMLQLTGVEIMRRLIGYAQLPLQAKLPRKLAWLECSLGLVKDPDPCRLTASTPLTE